MARINFTIDDDLLLRLDEIAEENFSTRSGMISKLIVDYIKNTHSPKEGEQVIHTSHENEKTDVTRSVYEPQIGKCQAPNVSCRSTGPMYHVEAYSYDSGEVNLNLYLCSTHVELLRKLGTVSEVK